MISGYVGQAGLPPRQSTHPSDRQPRQGYGHLPVSEWGTATPLWMRSQGLPVQDRVPGELTAWVVSGCGDWWAYVRFTVTVGGERLDLAQLVPASTVRPADTGGGG